MDGIKWPDEIICPPPAQWDPAARKVSLYTWRTQSWGYFDTNPVKDKSGLFYLPSGANFYNGAVYLGARYDVYYNEVIPRPIAMITLTHVFHGGGPLLEAC
jgi:hypothetical protein